MLYQYGQVLGDYVEYVVSVWFSMDKWKANMETMLYLLVVILVIVECCCN